MSPLEGELTFTSSDQSTAVVEGSKRKQQVQQPRQLLSCTKCRERKVKCDRTKPCSACCARGAPKDCHFIAEGGDYAPIQQSYELRKLRAENLRLKDRLRAYRISIDDEDSDYAASPESQLGERPGPLQRRRTGKQKRFQGIEWQDSIYFGSPALNSVMSDFASTNVDAAVTLAYLMPRGPGIHMPRTPRTYPFATLFKANPDECIPQLLSCLPAEEGELSGYLDAFDSRVNLCSYPQVPVEINRNEFERFLSHARRNAQMCPDMLALLFAAIALGAQHSVWDKSGEQWNAEIMQKETGKGDVYIAAAMQALRLASFLHKPSVLGIQALILIGPYLTNSGRFLDAWTLFGTTIRLAHSIGLHRHPKYLNPAPPTQKDCSIRQRLWWWMLRMDEQYSMTLGRPLGISGLGDCSWPQELTTDPIMLRFGDFVNRFTVIARRILSSDRLTNNRIDEFTDELRNLLDTIPETLQYQESWNQPEADAPEWPLRATAAMYHCKTYTYLILLNRQRVEKQSTFGHVPGARDPASSFQAINTTPSSHPSPTALAQASPRGRSLVLSSSEDVISAFMFFYHKEPAALIDWTLGQQAFNSAMLLLYDAIETRTVTTGARKAEQVFVVFKELDDNSVHELAGQAVDRISWGLAELHKMLSLSSTSSARPYSQQGVTEKPKGKDKGTFTSGSTDTVMGNTGMLLLEDTGLQAFVQEPYAPITWNLSETLDHPMKAREHLFPASVSPMRDDSASEEFHVVRSPGDMQSTRGSTTMGSAGARYTTSSLAKPPSCTRPASPTHPASHHQHAYKDDASSLHGQQQHGVRVHGNVPHHFTSHLQGVASGLEFQHHAQYSQSRQDSCPTLPQEESDVPRMRPIYSSSSTVSRQTRAHPRHVPICRGSTSGLYGSDRASFPAQLETDPQHMSYPFGTLVTSAAPSSLTPLAEDMSMDDWRQYIGNTGTS